MRIAVHKGDWAVRYLDDWVLELPDFCVQRLRQGGCRGRGLEGFRLLLLLVLVTHEDDNQCFCFGCAGLV